jgi:hypothetical protein
VAKGDGAADFSREVDAECTTQALAAVVALFLAVALEFDGSLVAGTDAENAVFISEEREVDLSGLDVTEVGAPFQHSRDVFPEPCFGESAVGGEFFGIILFAAARLGVTVAEVGCG